MEETTHHSSRKTHELNPILTYIDNAILVLWGIIFVLFPFIFTSATTDPFIFPKQLVLTGVVLVSLLLWGAKMILEGKTKLRRTPFDLPVALFTFFVLISVIFSVNRMDSILAFVPFLLVIIGYIILIHVIRLENSILFLVSALILGAAVLGLFETLTFLKLYILPMTYTHVQFFTPLGSLMEQAYYFIFLLPIAVYFAYPALKGNTNSKSIAFSIASLALVAGLAITLIQLVTTQRPVLLPFETGFQTAFAAISQDANRIAEGFFFGSGWGTFASDFTRFKQAPFNLNNDIWYLTFSQSSSFILELLATTGLLGVLSFLFLVWKIVKRSAGKAFNPLFPSLIMMLVTAFVLPFSFYTISIFFMLLALYISIQSLIKPKEFFDIELHLVALKKGLISMESQSEHAKNDGERGFTKIIPITFLVIFVAVAIAIGYFGTRYALADIDFQKSLTAAARNNGTETYNYEKTALDLFPYRDAYWRVFGQTNLALANSLAQVNKDQLAKNPQMQQTLYALIQQSITSGRNATAIAPMTVADWQNLASTYRALIGFGQNAESFSLLATQQAVAIDSANPQEYIALGGLYYQLGQYDNAIREFQTAINLKPDYANAYYNLGHAYEQKGDLKSALAQYQNVAQLVAKDPTNAKKITDEINAIQAKINGGSTSEGKTPTPTPTPSQPEASVTPKEQLNVNQSNSAIPTRVPQVKIPAPTKATQ